MTSSPFLGLNFFTSKMGTVTHKVRTQDRHLLCIAIFLPLPFLLVRVFLLALPRMAKLLLTPQNPICFCETGSSSQDSAVIQNAFFSTVGLVLEAWSPPSPSGGRVDGSPYQQLLGASTVHY